jgi:5-methylcytosine-specific restriction protein A
MMHFPTDGTAPIFEREHPFRRRYLHEAYGGQERGGISTPSKYPFVLLFTGESGERFGYRDEWLPDGTFRYTGEGQVGDMQLIAGNRAIRDHAFDGKDLYLFEKTEKAHVKYVGQMVCMGYEYVPNIPDRNGDLRTAIVFYLRPLESLATDGMALRSSETVSDEIALEREVSTTPLERFRELALAKPLESAPVEEALRKVYQRSAAVRAYVIGRAEGICEGCGAPAPFQTPSGRPYLEPHHTRRLSDGGPDHPAHVIALCPTCHRRAHYAADHTAFNDTLIQTLRQLESLGHYRASGAAPRQAAGGVS